MTFNFKGKEIGLRFGVRALSYFEKARNLPISKALSDLESIDSQIDLIHSAARDYCKSQGIKEEFSRDDVFDWLDEIGFEKVSEIVTEGLTQYFSKKKNQAKEEVITQ